MGEPWALLCCATEQFFVGRTFIFGLQPPSRPHRAPHRTSFVASHLWCTQPLSRGLTVLAIVKRLAQVSPRDLHRLTPGQEEEEEVWTWGAPSDEVEAMVEEVEEEVEVEEEIEEEVEEDAASVLSLHQASLFFSSPSTSSSSLSSPRRRLSSPRRRLSSWCGRRGGGQGYHHPRTPLDVASAGAGPAAGGCNDGVLLVAGVTGSRWLPG
ncbi:uncharacterized protein LOC144950946 [Lampetra fluviatilis]